jgi:hypothetical protein
MNLTPERIDQIFEEYLAELPDVAIAGHRRATNCCPVARALRTRRDVYSATIGRLPTVQLAGVVWGDQFIQLSPRMQAFLIEIDKQERGLVRASEARALWKEAECTG